MLQRTLPAGFIAPCLPIKTDRAALRQRMAARDQARWFSGDRPQERRTGQALQPSRPMISPIRSHWLSRR